MKELLIFSLLAVILFSGCIEQGCTKEQLETTAKTAIINEIGEQYYNEHYVLDSINSEWNIVYHKIKFDDEISDQTLQTRIVTKELAEKYNMRECVDITDLYLVTDVDELNITRDEAVQIASAYNFTPNYIAFYLQFVNQKWIKDNFRIEYEQPAWDMCQIDPCRKMRINAITGEVVLHYCLPKESC